MTVHDIVEVITSRYRSVKVTGEPLKLGNVLWPVSRNANLAYRYWPEFFRGTAS